MSESVKQHIDGIRVRRHSSIVDNLHPDLSAQVEINAVTINALIDVVQDLADRIDKLENEKSLSWLGL